MKAGDACSETLFQSAQKAFYAVVALVVSILGGYTASTLDQPPTPAHTPFAIAVEPGPTVPKASRQVARTTEPSSLLRYSYVFEGVASHNGQPVALAGIVIKIRTPGGEQVKGALTDSEGRYSVSFRVFANEYEPIRWTIEARSTESRAKVKLTGQRIAMQESDIVVEQALAMAVSDYAPRSPFYHDDSALNP